MLEVCVLGPLEVRVDGHLVALGGRRPQVLLAMLAAGEGSVVSADALVHAVWGDDPPPSARNSLQSHVSRLRKALAAAGSPDRIEARGPGYTLRIEPGELDAAVFQSLIEQALAEKARSAADPDAVGDDLRRALSLWRGDAFAGLDDCERLRAAGARLGELQMQAVEARFDAELAAGHHARVLPELEAAVVDQPLRERRWRQLMVALYRSGRQADAVRAGRRYREVLGDETGLAPGADFVALDDAVVRGELDGQVPGEPVPVAPQAPSAVALPTSAAALVGRDHELAAARRRLAAVRLLTVTGMGGVGKTCFALDLARAWAGDDRAGVHLVELAPLRPADAIDLRVADVLGAGIAEGEPAAESVARRLGRRPTLLVLDNCEHVLDQVADLVAALLATCPALTVLATSRERLAVDGEHVWPLAPLPHDPAVELLTLRTQAHRPGFTLHPGNRDAVGEIVRRLDGLPLALELAAARLAAVTPTELATLLREPLRALTNVRRTGEERHRTLEQVLDWSWKLLEPAEQATLAQLSVLAAPFTFPAAAAVTDVAEIDVVSTLARLVDASLVQATDVGGATRFSMLETVRRFAAHRLAEHDDQPRVVERHTAWVLARVGALGRALGGPGERSAASEIDAELADVRAVVQRLLDAGDGLRLAELLAALDRWAPIGAGAESRQWMVTACAVVARTPGPHQGTALGVAGAAAALSGDRVRAVELGERSWALGATVPGEPLAVVALFDGRLAESESLFRRAFERADPQDAYLRAHHLCSMSLALAYQGRSDDACEVAAAAAREAERTGAPSARAWTRYAMGEACADTRPEQAMAVLDEAVDVAREGGFDFVLGLASHASASLHARHGDPRAALPRLAETLRLWHHVGAWTQMWTTLRNTTEVLARLGLVEESLVLRAHAEAAAEAASIYGSDVGRDDELAAAATAELGTEHVAVLQAAGARIDREEAVERALSAIDTILADGDGPTPG